MPASGIGRAAELLTGSRLAKMEGAAASRITNSARHNASAERIFKDAFHGGVPAEKKFVRESYRTGVTHAGADRAMRAADVERKAVKGARQTALGAGLAGAGALALGSQMGGSHEKTATTMEATPSMFQSMTGATGHMGEKSLMDAAARSVAPASERAAGAVAKSPLLSTRAKVIGGVGLAGLGAGMALAHHRHKEAALKEAFGAGFGTALMSGLKGMKNFAGTAGKSIAAAGRAGGMQAAGQAAMNAGRSGLMRAGQFVAQNPGAGAALVAAPALAAGYAAGRQ